MRLSHRWYTTSGLLYRPDSRLCARADQRESSEMSAQSIPLKDRTDLQLQPCTQFAFELRDAAPNASAPEVPHDAPQHLGNPRRLTRALARDAIPPTRGITERAVSAFTPQNLTNDGDENPCRMHRPRPSRKLVPFGSEIWSAHQFGKECQPNRGHREAHISPPEADVRSSVNRIALGTIIGEQPWREMLAAEGHRPTAYLACAN